MKGQKDLIFEVVSNSMDSASYTAGCSGGRSDCCTRTCTRPLQETSNTDMAAWENYLDINAGVLQY